MENILNWLTASGSLATAASVVSAFVLYKKELDNSNTNKIRKALQVLFTNINELNKILGPELAHEMTSSVIYSSESQYSIKEIYNICKDAIEKKTDKNTVIEKIKESLGVFVVSFHNDLSIKYNSLLSEISYQSIVFNPNYQGLYRFTSAVVTWMSNIFVAYKQILINESLLSNFIYNEMVDSHKPFRSYEEFQKELSDNLLSLIETQRISKWQDDIYALLSLVNLIYSTHIELSNSDWNKLKRKIRSISLTPYDVSGKVTDDFREAEKHFRTLLNHDGSMQYISLVQSMESNNK